MVIKRHPFAERALRPGPTGGKLPGVMKGNRSLCESVTGVS